MYLRLEKILKKVGHRIVVRINGLLLYFHDYVAIGFCLTYIIVQPVIITLARNISSKQTIGLLVCLVCILLGVLQINRRVLRGNRKIFNKRNTELYQKKYAQIFSLSYYILIASILTIIRFFPVITMEKRIESEGLGFTDCSTQVIGFVTEKPVQKYAYQQLEVEILQVSVGNEQKNLQDKVKIAIKTEKFQELSIGQRCNFSGRLVVPRNSDDFNYKDYLKNKGIFFTMDFPTIECEDVETIRYGSSLVNRLTEMRTLLESKIDEILNEPQSSLLCGILFGSDRLLSKDFEEGIRIAGVSHIISASGYNITIISLGVAKVFSFLPKKGKIVVNLFTIWLFAIFSGLSPSIIRACIMSSISLIAVIFGRNNSVHIALPLTAFLFLIINPLVIFDIGFQLSISSMAGLVYISPILEKLLPKKKFVKDNLVSTMSCTISTIPISVYTFKTISLWSIFANMLILPVVQSTMFFGIIGLVVGILSSQLQYFFFTVINLQLKYFEFIVEAIGKTGVGSFVIGNNIAIPSTLIFATTLIFLIIYLYPIENESCNYYLKEN
ncbi:MAG TPA: ComEC/Rec2 family competence protein [Candidatus Dojkabacteria bacterium]|nr:ComEC/Rec2 family competence protein [Candidatus Dojkabacteria bacterium]